jgi:hypothetical protein
MATWSATPNSDGPRDKICDMQRSNAQSDNKKPKGLLTWDRLAEERIQAAQAEGQFDHLPGFGKPIPGIDEPHDELWWVKEKLKREQLSSLPPALAIRLDVEKTLALIEKLPSETEVRQAVSVLNEHSQGELRRGLGAACGCHASGGRRDREPLEVG